eukprot:1415278-Pleurochrysis_carterae.AAC.1
MHVRAAVRRRCIASDGSLYGELSALKDERVLLRRRARLERFHKNKHKRLAELESLLMARDKEIIKLTEQLLAHEKNEVLRKRRLAN